VQRQRDCKAHQRHLRLVLFEPYRRMMNMRLMLQKRVRDTYTWMVGSLCFLNVFSFSIHSAKMPVRKAKERVFHQ